MSERLFGISGITRFKDSFNFRRPSGNERYPIMTREQWTALELRRNADCPRHWLIETLEALPGEDELSEALETCKISPYLAVFAHMVWENKILTFCSMIAIYTEGEVLDNYILPGPHRPGKYFRMDYSEEERGGLFSHPFPHIHSSSDGGPRFPFQINEHCFVPLAFLEFLAIAFHYEKWKAWAVEVCRGSSQCSFIVETGQSLDDIFHRFGDLNEWREEPRGGDKITAFHESLESEKLALFSGFPRVARWAFARPYCY